MQLKKHDVVDLDIYPDVPSSPMWIPELLLTANNKCVILDGDWLLDSHIGGAQKLLKKQFPFADILQETIHSG